MRILYSQAYPSLCRVPLDAARRGTKIETLPEEPGLPMTDEVVTLIGPFDQASQHAPELQRSSSSANRWMRSGSPLPPSLRDPSASSYVRLHHPKHRRFGGRYRSPKVEIVQPRRSWEVDSEPIDLQNRSELPGPQ